MIRKYRGDVIPKPQLEWDKSSKRTSRIIAGVSSNHKTSIIEEQATRANLLAHSLEY